MTSSYLNQRKPTKLRIIMCSASMSFTYWGRVTHICVTELDHHWFQVMGSCINQRWLIVEFPLPGLFSRAVNAKICKQLELHKLFLLHAWLTVTGHERQTFDWNAVMMTSSNGNLSAFLALCAGNSLVTGDFPHPTPTRVVTRNFE